MAFLLPAPALKHDKSAKNKEHAMSLLGHRDRCRRSGQSGHVGFAPRKRRYFIGEAKRRDVPKGEVGRVIQLPGQPGRAPSLEQ